MKNFAAIIVQHLLTDIIYAIRITVFVPKEVVQRNGGGWNAMTDATPTARRITTGTRPATIEMGHALAVAKTTSGATNVIRPVAIDALGACVTGILNV